MYVDDQTTLYLVAMLKAYGIKYIVSNPGTQNAGFNLCVQEDKDFKCFSVVDERSAAYVATGLAFETGEPVVITCTGATASRNYLSALTEAFYRKLPIIAITYTHYANKFNLEPQTLDRSVSQNDVKALSIELPVIDSDADKNKCISYINAALTKAFSTHMPIHINVVNSPKLMSFTTHKLPQDFWITKLYKDNFGSLKNELNNKKIGIFVGEHKNFSTMEEKALSDFAQSYNAAVFCDHTSNYHGSNKILISQIVERTDADFIPDIMIDMGGISGEYSSGKLFKKVNYWRISPDGEFHSRCGRPVSKLFVCKEEDFFSSLKAEHSSSTVFYNKLDAACKKIKTPELPLCNALVCQYLSQYIPENSSLHLGILNSLRNMNFFQLPNNIDVVCNVGGFGIDGPVSSAIGQSLASDKKVFALLGDLAFFYDMNALGIREIKNNLRILVVNNNRGEEFRLNPLLEGPFKEKTDVLVAAAGHNKGGMKGWAEACSFHYMTVSSKDMLEEKIKEFCTKSYDKPVLFEVYTTNEDEQKGLSLMRSKDKQIKNNSSKSSLLKKIIGKR